MVRTRWFSPMLSLIVIGLSAQVCALPRLAPTSVSGMVWLDANGDGVRDSGESGMPGVDVALVTAADSKVSAQSTTDGSGAYSFSGVEQHAYRVAFSLPDGYAFSPKGQGTDDSLDSDVNAGGPFPGQTDSFVPGQNNQGNWDAGLVAAHPEPTAVPATPEIIPSTPLPSPEPITEVAGDYNVQFLVAIDNGQNAPLVNLPSTGVLHVTQNGQELTMEIIGADPGQTRLTFDSQLDAFGTTSAFAPNLVGGIQDVRTQIAGGFLRVDNGDITISFTLEVGVDGELPGGQEVVYSIVSE